MANLQLNLQYFAGEKTEKATPKKRKETREKGQVAKSQDINTAIVLLVVFVFLWIGKDIINQHILLFVSTSLEQNLLKELTVGNVLRLSSETIVSLLWMILPVFGIVMVAAVAANLGQIGFLFTTESLQFKLERINPIEGFQRIYSLRAIVELLKSILKISVVGSVAFSIIWVRKEDFLSLSLKSPFVSYNVLYDLMVQVGVWASMALLIIAVLDFAYQKFDYEKKIRMSKQDIKDEVKKSEGDPLVKSKIRQKQREMAMRRMMQEIPKADVIITNPTHYAIALKYDEYKRDAPYVVAKGMDFLAQKIKEVAKENKIEIIENKPLARALYQQTEVGDEIPEVFFKAVAEILAYVYRIKKKV